MTPTAAPTPSATVDLPSLRLSALQVCVGMAVSSGVKGLEAAVLLTEADGPDAADLTALAELGGAGIVVHLGGVSGRIHTTTTA